MLREIKTSASLATMMALAAMVGSFAAGEDRAPIRLKRDLVKATPRAQNSDDDIFDSQLLDRPRLQKISESALSEGPYSPVCEPELSSPYDHQTPPAVETPFADTGARPFAPFNPGDDSLAGLSAAARTPSMMGDFFGGGTTTFFAPDDFFDSGSLLAPPPPGSVVAVPIPDGATAGIMKLAENSSPIPRDRLFVNYSYFSNVALNANGVNVSRVTPGFEKTVFEGLASVELRMPFATTLDSDIRNLDLPGGSSDTGVEFGNLTTTFKSYLYNNSRLAITGGLGIAFPTADDVTVSLSDGTEVLQFQNQAVRLMPFLGGLYTPNDRLFVQNITQVDGPMNGQNTLFNGDFSGLQKVGVYTPQTYLYFDTVLGYWFYNNFEPGARVSGMAGMFEVHYNSSLNQSDVIYVPDPSAPGVALAQIGRPDTFNQCNIVVGTTIELLQSSSLQLGYATTVSGDRIFDGELRCNYNYYFGRNLYGRSYRPGRT